MTADDFLTLLADPGAVLVSKLISSNGAYGAISNVTPRLPANLMITNLDAIEIVPLPSKYGDVLCVLSGGRVHGLTRTSD